MEMIFIFCLFAGLIVAPRPFPDALNPIPVPASANQQIRVPLNISTPSLNTVPLDFTFVLSGNHTIVDDALTFRAVAKGESNASLSALNVTRIVVSPSNAITVPIAIGGIVTATTSVTTQIGSIGVPYTSYGIHNGTVTITRNNFHHHHLHCDAHQPTSSSRFQQHCPQSNETRYMGWTPENRVYRLRTTWCNY